MNLYDLHPDPESCPWYDWDHENIPELIIRRYCTQPEELKKRTHILIQQPLLAALCARDFIKGPFPEAETAIAQDPIARCCYIRDVLWQEGVSTKHRNRFMVLSFPNNPVLMVDPDGTHYDPRDRI